MGSGWVWGGWAGERRAAKACTVHAWACRQGAARCSACLARGPWWRFIGTLRTPGEAKAWHGLSAVRMAPTSGSDGARSSTPSTSRGASPSPDPACSSPSSLLALPPLAALPPCSCSLRSSFLAAGCMWRGVGWAWDRVRRGGGHTAGGRRLGLATRRTHPPDGVHHKISQAVGLQARALAAVVPARRASHPGPPILLRGACATGGQGDRA